MDSTTGPAADAVAPPRATAPRSALTERLLAEPWAYEFFEALRRIECEHPQRSRFGRATRLQDEPPVRLGQVARLEFPPADLHGVRERDDGVLQLWGYGFGLFGPHGPLPIHLTEYAYERELHFRDSTFARFADVFHHRAASLFYRAWADAQPTVQYDRPDEDGFAKYVGALIGIASPALTHRDSAPDVYKRHFAGRLLPAAKNPEAIEQLVSTWFDVPARVVEFTPGWAQLPADSHLYLGVSMFTGTLGETAVIGDVIWLAQNRARLRLGPMSLDSFKNFLPGRGCMERLAALVRTCTGDELAYDVQLILRREEVPPQQLGINGQLGWDTWLWPESLQHDSDDAVLTLVA